MKKLPAYSVLFLLLLLFYSCDSPRVIHDLSSNSYTLVNQDSSSVNFPDDFKGNYLVVGFIYTHCPDICSITTANMKNVYRQLEDTSNIHFVEITFDPRRDTPTVLKKYMQNFELNEQQFMMLTGDSTTIDSVLNKMGIVAQISHRDTTDSGKINYFMNHTDRISVMDPQGRVRYEYPGSKVPPEHIVEDLNKLR